MPAPVAPPVEAIPVYTVTSAFNGRLTVPGFPNVFRLGSKQTFTGILTPAIRNLVGARKLTAKRVKTAVDPKAVVAAPAVSPPAAPIAPSVSDSTMRTSGRS